MNKKHEILDIFEICKMQTFSFSLKFERKKHLKHFHLQLLKQGN